ncbi:hypothetical protein HOG17_04420 [Candidatus Peregrinibacteria bacterium]|nr:hypothetical protein [Candidatus Peregrinibacteria bacterium]MBT4148447.1 hypothetical protein [Candidatus Peregrinibacteria bacterium]MBT4456488.1 hypothetical protein [Candidatus Peregrinibacteria bacterium]
MGGLNENEGALGELINASSDIVLELRQGIEGQAEAEVAPEDMSGIRFSPGHALNHANDVFSRLAGSFPQMAGPTALPNQYRAVVDMALGDILTTDPDRLEGHSGLHPTLAIVMEWRKRMLEKIDEVLNIN